MAEITYRVLIFDDDDNIRKLLWTYFDKKGFEVFTFPNPASCPLCKKEICPCPIKHACADFILTDFEMPIMKGLNFLEEQINKGCRCNHMALMSGNLSNKEIQHAKELGVAVFHKPFNLKEIDDWVEKSIKTIPDERILSSWFIKDEKQ